MTSSASLRRVVLLRERPDAVRLDRYDDPLGGDPALTSFSPGSTHDRVSRFTALQHEEERR